MTTLGAPTESPEQWHRLDARMLAVGPLRGLVQVLPLIAVIVLTGSGEQWRLWATVAVGVLVIVFAVIRWRTTRYRITDRRIELHTGLLNRQERSVPLDRIRNVDVTVQILHRIFGLAVVKVGVGTGDPFADSKGVNLDAVTAAEAERLRLLLLERARQARSRDHPSPTTSPDGAVPAGQPAAAGAEPEVISRIDWSWLRFAPLTATSLAGIGVIISAGYNLLESTGIRARDLPGVSEATRQLNEAPVWLAVLQVGGVLLALAVLGAVLMYVERWWGYLLTREPDGSLLMRRGLLTRRTLAVAHERLRGAEVVEGLLLRAGRGGQARALTTGLSREALGGAILPPAALAEAHRVAAAALAEPPSEVTETALDRHPGAALRRRLSRALIPAVALAAVGWVLADRVPALFWLWPGALVAIPIALALALDRYRNLGHALTDRYLVSRQGSMLRRTAAVQRDGIIGWRVAQSPFQRRAGVVTLEAVTAAGRGGYEIVDVAPARAADLMAATTPEAVDELLDTRPAATPTGVGAGSRTSPG